MAYGEEMGTKFGPAQQDIETVTQWLGSHGLQVNTVFKNGMTIDVSGTAGQVRDTFHTEIHKYLVNGKQHIANASDPQIPATVAPVVVGVVSLNDFMPKSALIKPIKNFSIPCNGCPDGFNGVPLYLEGPADLATIYTSLRSTKRRSRSPVKGKPLWCSKDTDINSADVATFRKAFGLTSYSGTFAQIHPGTGCSDPGMNNAESEAALDAEWAGAVAPDASVELASCADTATNFGGFIAAQNLLDLTNPPPVMSLSYINCEADNGPGTAHKPTATSTIFGNKQQVRECPCSFAAGDGAAAGCDAFDTATYAVGGIAANGLASTPYDVCYGRNRFSGCL